jgi:ribosomal-protein-alanine N-acetyltransferase
MVNWPEEFPFISTNRLNLREIEMEDAYRILDYRNNKKNFEHVIMSEFKTIQEAENHVKIMKKGFYQKDWILWSISLKNNNEIIGTISLWNFKLEDESAEFGFGIFPKHRKKGYMKETLVECINFAFNKLHLKKIYAFTNVTNIESKSLLETLNFNYEGEEIDDYGPEYGKINQAIYSIKL